MAFSDGGLLGKTRGKVGNLIYYTRMGKPLVRSIGINLVPPTDAQLACRMQISAVSAFTKIIKGFVNVSFKAEAKKQNKMVNTLVNSVNKAAALKGDYPDIEMDFTKAIVSNGDLAIAESPDVVIANGGLKFTWNVAEQLPWPDISDQALLLAYLPHERKAYYSLFGNLRASGTGLLSINQPMLNKRMETYIAFLAADGNRASDSVFVKTLNG
ncbi:MAG: DUF6266 family protein [Bacteroidota bacterium]